MLLRVPFLDAPLGRDEGGDTLIGLGWSTGGPFAYGAVFLDRPPLLLLLYRVAAQIGGDAGVRGLGLLAAIATVVLVAAVTRQIGGGRAAALAAIVAAATLSSQALTAVYTPAELLAIVPSCASVALLVRGLRRDDARTLAAAGLLAVAAVLVKQSFADAGLAALAALVLAPRRLGAYAAGAAAGVAALVARAVTAGISAYAVWYALFGFRIDALGVAVDNQANGGLLQLLSPAWHSGVLVAGLATVVGVATVKDNTLRRVLLGWLAGGLVAIVVSGGNYAPYLIELIPVTSVGAGLALTRWPRVGLVVTGVIAVLAVVPTLRTIRDGSAGAVQRRAQTTGRYVAGRALPGQSAYVLYAGANVLFYTGLRPAFPYQWALMMRAIDSAPKRLDGLLASPRRPTWIVELDASTAFGLDPDGETRRLLRRHYAFVDRVCGARVLLARGAKARPATPNGGC